MFIDQWTKIAPKHWTRKKLKHIASLRSGESITADSIKDEGDFPVYGGNGLRGFTGEYTHEGEFVLIGRQGALCGNVNYARDRFWASEHAVVVTRLGDDDLTWLGELLRYLDLNRLSQSAAQPGISAEEVSNVLLAVPPLEEQRRISAYLKSETARLDALVAAKQRLIDLLAEKRKAIIATAVTRGVDPKVKLRDSGVPWLGEIPAHWEIVPFRWYFRIGSGDFIATDEVASEPDAARVTPVIGGNGVAGYAAAANTSDAASIVVGRVGAQCGNVHVITGLAWVTDNALLLREIREYDVEYLAHVLRHRDLNSIANKTAQPLITGSMVTELRGPHPPLDEQRAVVAHIARETAKLDAVRAATERTIALLKERRSALIAAAVTGQLDVGAAA
jgi:type I restriction enzyme, S subunit